jgi:predicted O-methyltransferase YrrM
MTNTSNQTFPTAYAAIDAASRALGFSMPSDPLTCTLLRSLAASKPAGQFLELGTGTGLATAWILEGMDGGSSLISLDFEQTLLDVAQAELGDDPRLELVCSDGGVWLEQNKNLRFDYIFADTWHGKYLMLDETLAMLKPGALYIIDDMLPQANWPEGHAEKAEKLIAYLESRNDLVLSKLAWASGVIVAVKKPA